MSLVPEFELGLWNAWLFPLLHQGLTSVVLYLIYRDSWKDVWDIWKKAPTDTSSSKIGRRLQQYTVYLMYLAVFGYSIFLPLKLNTVWFYVGLSIYLLGVFFDFSAGVSWATNPLDKPITTGIYSISRTPTIVSLVPPSTGSKVYVTGPPRVLPNHLSHIRCANFSCSRLSVTS